MERESHSGTTAAFAALLIALAVPGAVPTADGGGLVAQEPATSPVPSASANHTRGSSELAGAARTAVRLEYEGAPALGLALRRLGRTPRVLMIGAHPDDENTSLLASLALGRGADVAYLSLTRGEGGQNLIGSELKDALGLIRSEELLAARRLDGAGQFFSRAYDFGFSKHADEAFLHWPRDELLDDVVAVVRTFRPDVIVSIFSGTPSDGHGQHQAAGIMAREAFEAAGDPERFPAQLARGLEPHSPARLYQALWRPQGDERVRVETGTLDPLFGRSHHQIAMASRARHRSQGMGGAEPPGPREAALRLVASRSDSAADIAGADPFAGLPVTLEERVRAAAEDVDGGTTTTSAFADAGRSAGHSPASRALADAAAYDALTDTLRSDYNALEPDALVPALTAALERLDRLAEAGAESGALRFHVAAECADLHDALRRAARIELDALADDETVVPGQEFELELTLWNGGERAVRLAALEPALPMGWAATRVDTTAGAADATVPPNTLVTRRFRVRVPEDADPTEPYFLRTDRDGDMYVWPDAGELRGRPFGPPSVAARARVELAGATLPLEREATVRVVDRARGEDRRPLRVVPAVAVSVEPGTAVLPVGRAKTFELSVRLAAEAPDGIAGLLRLDAPDGWTVRPVSDGTAADADGGGTNGAPTSSTVRSETDAGTRSRVGIPVRFTAPGQVRTVELEVEAPADASPGSHAVRAVFQAEDRRET
ncbi:MAG: PIG-L family deacetylase, partial [Gemmatimonadota bacterium]